MQTKAYFANSVPAALEVARQELGENALLVGSRPTPPLVRHFGRLEVTFAWDPKDTPKDKFREPAGDVMKRLPPPPAPTPEMDEIRLQLAALRAALERGVEPAGGGATPISEDSLLIEKLTDAGLSRATAADVASGAAGRGLSREASVVHELAGRISVEPFVDMKSGESRTLAFIGPPGRGKTTSMIKIAVKLGLTRRVPVRIYCAGAHCTGAQEQTARLAAILGTPYQVCESLASLNLALNGEAWKGLSLIDTPGISPADRAELGELTSFFTARPEIEKHLVLRAEASFADMVHTMSRFSGLNPSRLLFTGMDEAIRLGPMIETLMHGGIPAAFAGNGQQIPDDLETVSAEGLARAFWAGAAQAARHSFAQAAA